MDNPDGVAFRLKCPDGKTLGPYETEGEVDAVICAAEKDERERFDGRK
jgi:hypothetical protein